MAFSIEIHASRVGFNKFEHVTRFEIDNTYACEIPNSAESDESLAIIAATEALEGKVDFDPKLCRFTLVARLKSSKELLADHYKLIKRVRQLKLRELQLKNQLLACQETKTGPNVSYDSRTIELIKKLNEDIRKTEKNSSNAVKVQ